MRNLIESWPEIARRVQSSASVALFLDFDGTLSPIVAQPHEAALERGTRAALLRLSANPRVNTYIISGRRWADLRARVAVPGFRYLGVHGWDSDGKHKIAPELLQRIGEARSGLAARLNGTKSVQVEDKGVSFALHYRGASESAVQKARMAIYQTMAEYGDALRVMEGDRVWEVLPWEIRGKGHQARKHWQRLGPGVLPFYVGNDDTDEPAFRALASGVTVRVGRAHGSRARYTLRSPVEVRRLLERLEEAVRGRAIRRSNSL
jgi:trehalose 6-phosphate phosphatase